MARTSLRHPHWEPCSDLLRLRVTEAQIEELDRFAAEFAVTRSWLVRQAVGRGLPVVLAELRDAAARGLRVAPVRLRGGRATVRGSFAGGAAGVTLEPVPPSRGGRTSRPPRGRG